MEVEHLQVLYDYEYDYKDRKISIIRDEKLKLLQRTNQHWWKVVRPGINKAFFVPAQYVQSLPPPETSAEGDNNNDGISMNTSPDSSPNCVSKYANTSNFTMTPTITKKPLESSSSSASSKIKRTDSIRASKRAHKLKNWSASLEELSKQIVFPGISSESVVNLNTTTTVTVTSTSLMCTEDSRSTSKTTASGSSKPIPLPRKSMSEGHTGPSCPSPSPGTQTPKPIPKARSKTLIGDTNSSNKSSGGSSEVLTSSEELLVSPVSMRHSNYKEDSVSSRRTDEDEIDEEDSSQNIMRPRQLSPTDSASGRRPAKPPPDARPHRLLLDNWAEFVNHENRFYYYNSLSGATSWKPPRVNSIRQDSSLDESTNTSLLSEDANHHNNNQSHARLQRDNSPPAHEPLLVLSLPTEETQLPVPEGWSCLWDEGLGQFCYVHHVTGARWFSSQDPQGKIYYYEENSSKSSWFLPVPGISLNEENSSSSPLSKSGTSDSLEGRETSPPKGSGGPSPMPDVVNLTPIVKKRHSTGEVTDRFLKSRSMLILSDSTRGKTSEHSKNSSLPRPQLKSIWSFSRDETELVVIKEGLLTRTKITEHGKKVRKNWASAYAVLTAQHLSLFKDQKSFASRKPELEIELAGSTVDWSTDKSSRKNVFQLNTNTDLQMLFQSEDNEISLDWIEALKDIIKRQPVTELLRLRSTSPDPYMDNPVGEKKTSRLGRAKSTKLKITGSVENLTSDEKHRIRAQLKKFFNRRPARESLVKKGIYKDESVFGCLLDKLCAREGRPVPNFVQECIAAIESKEEHLKTDGIYRASGNLSQVQKIRLQVDQNHLNCLYQEEDVHVLAGSLKLFFREMREPLIPTELFDQALTASNLHIRKEKISKFRDIVSKLAKPNRATLHVLLRHLLKVAEYSDFNRMLIPNLAIVFGPTLMWPAQESTNMALDLMQQNFVIEALLLDFDSIFERR